MTSMRARSLPKVLLNLSFGCPLLLLPSVGTHVTATCLQADDVSRRAESPLSYDVLESSLTRLKRT